MFVLGKMDSQVGCRLSLRCGSCRRPLGIFYQKKRVSSPIKLIVLKGSLHRTEKGTPRIHITCKCGAKNVFDALTDGRLNPNDPRMITVRWYKHLLEMQHILKDIERDGAIL